jgi:thioredoxin-like negative regulator of GroEL
MLVIDDFEKLEELKANGAVLILFGGERCAVCQSVRAKLEPMLEQRFARLNLAYVDCEKSTDICARCGVFSLPVVKVYIEGMLVAEAARVFGINDLITRIERPYALWLESADEQPQ